MNFPMSPGRGPGAKDSKSLEEEKNLLLDRPMRGKSQDQIRRHSLDSAIDNKPIERSLYILTMGDDAQKISVVHSLPQLIALDSSAVYNRIIPKIKQDLPSASCEFQIATSAIFMLLLQRSANTSILQSVIQGTDSKDPNVAYAWLEALYGSMGSLPEIMIQNYLLPLAKQKFQPNSPVTSKVFCGKLMGEICSNSKFRVLDVKRDILPIVIGLCQDGHPDVRAQMCSFIPKVAAVLGNDWEKTNLLSCIVDLAQDENLNVRAASIVAITSMLRKLSAETSRSTLLPLIKKLCMKASDESLVTALILSDEFGNLMREMPPISDQDVMFFIRIYKQLSLKGKQQSTGVRANASIEVTIRQRCATNSLGIMKVVMQSLPSQLQDVYAVFREHAIDPCYLVRRAAAGVLADIAVLLGNQNTMMKDEIVRLLRDDAVEVLDAIVPTVSTIFKCLHRSGLLSHTQVSQPTIEIGKALVKCQNELAKRYNWRLSVEFLKQLEILPLCVPSDYIHNNFTPVMFDKLIYGNAKPVRYQAAKTLVVFMRYNFKPNQSKWIRDSLVRQAAQSRSCHHRVLYFYVCEAVLSVFSEKYFKEWFLAPCLVLSQDRIANVRWKFMQFSSKLKSMVTLAADVQTKQKIVDAITKLESTERTKTGMDIIRIKKREPLPKYSPEALREEDFRVKEEATTNMMRPDPVAPKVSTAPAGPAKKVSIPGPEMRFLQQHFYIDAGIKLESIIGLAKCSNSNSKPDTELDATDFVSLASCNITDDVKVNLRNMNKRGKQISKLPPKRYSSIISASAFDLNTLNDKVIVQKRRNSLNINRSDSKIPIPNRTKLSTSMPKILLAIEEPIQNIHKSSFKCTIAGVQLDESRRTSNTAPRRSVATAGVQRPVLNRAMISRKSL